MLRTVGPQGSRFESLLLPGCGCCRGELADVERLLDEPIETYLRLMFLKNRFGLGTCAPDS